LQSPAINHVDADVATTTTAPTSSDRLGPTEPASWPACIVCDGTLGPTDSPQIHSACRKTVYDWETPSAERKASTDGSGLFVEQHGAAPNTPHQRIRLMIKQQLSTHNRHETAGNLWSLGQFSTTLLVHHSRCWPVGVSKHVSLLLPSKISATIYCYNQTTPTLAAMLHGTGTTETKMKLKTHKTTVGSQHSESTGVDKGGVENLT